MKKWNDKAKKAVIAAGAGAAAAAILAGLVFGLRGRGEPVGVYPFSMVGMTEFWGDNQESYGPVTTDRIQTVFLSDTQTITEVLVKEGDKVKKGDVLMTYDTTLSELQLERKRLDVEKAKLQVREAEEELARINQMKPMGSTGGDLPIVSEDYGDTIREIYNKDYKPFFDSQVGGNSAENPLVVWVSMDRPLDNELLNDLYEQIIFVDRRGSSASALPEDIQPLSREGNSGSDNPQQTVSYRISLREKTVSGSWAEVYADTADCVEGDVLSAASVAGALEYEGKTFRFQFFSVDGGAGQSSVTVEAGQSITAVYTFDPVPNNLRLTCPLMVNGQIFAKQGEMIAIPFTLAVDNDNPEVKVNWNFVKDDLLTGVEAGRSYFLYGIPDTVGTKPYSLTATYGTMQKKLSFELVVTENTNHQPALGEFYIVLRVTKEDKQYAPYVTWQGIQVTVYEGGNFGLRLYDAPASDPFAKEEEDTPIPDVSFDSGMTAAEIAKLRREQEKKIKELAAAAKMTESEYNLMVREFTDGSIRAALDGEVVRLLSEEESRQTKQPVMKVSGGGGFYVQGSVSELEKDRLKLGQEVTVSDWNTGMTYTGQVESIGDFPVEGDGWNGVGNPNASYYPFRVFIDGTADLQEGSYVSVTYSAAEAENGVYLENPFLRTDDGDPYVYIRGKNGRLEKRAVTTGKSLWGSFTEIRSGLTAEDYVAFPYGKTVKPGAATVESDLSALYGY